MASRSLVYKLLLDASGAASGARKFGNEAQGLSRRLSGLKGDTLEVREAMLKVERATAAQTRVLKTQKNNILAVQGANLRLERAQRDLARAQDSTRRSTSRLSGSMKTMAGSITAAFSVYAVVDFAKQSVQAYEEVIKVNKQTEAVLKSTGHAAGMQKKDILDLAQAISRKTAIDDEQIQSAENLLLTFTKIGKDTFPQVTKTVVDMSVALGQDFKSSSIQVGKALNDPIKGLTALQRVGVSFTADQKKQIEALVASGKTLEAQKMILRELSREFGGSAEKAATPMMRMKVAVGNLKEEIGRGLYPVVTDVANKMAPFIQGFVDGTGAGGRFRDKLNEIWKAAQPTVKAIGQLALNIGKFVEKNPALLKVAAGIAAVGLAIKGLKFASAVSGLSNFISAAGSVGTKAGGAFKGGFGKSMTMSRGEASTAVGPMSRAMGVAFGVAMAAAAAGTIVKELKGRKLQVSPGSFLPTNFTQDFAPLSNLVLNILKPGEKSLRDFGGTAKKALEAFKDSGAAKGMGDLAAKARTMAGQFPQYRNQLMLLARTLDENVGQAFQTTMRTVRDSFKGMNGLSLRKIRQNVEANMALIEGALGTNSREGRKAVKRNFDLAIDAIQGAMRDGKLSTRDGMRQIRSYLAQELEYFGQSLPGLYDSPPGTSGRRRRNNGPQGFRQTPPSQRAGGGWIGAPGMAGQDTVPAMLGVGEAVLNRHQQVPVENALRATYGISLDQLFGLVRRPHYLAGGGKIPHVSAKQGLGAVTTISQAAIDKDRREAQKIVNNAAAQSVGPDGGPGGETSTTGLVGQVLRAIAWARRHGWRGSITSGFRSRAKQQYLWDNAPALGLIRGVSVAKPGSSRHEYGQAIDVTDVPGFQRAMASAPRNARLIWRGASDPVHFSVDGHARGGFLRRFAGGGWVRTGATRFDDPPPGAGNLGRPGYHFAELGTATKSGRGTGRGYLARLFGLSGELPMGTKLQVRRGGKTITADKQDRGYGQGSSSYAIDLWRGAADALGVSKGPVEVRLLTGAKQSTSEIDKKHSALDKKWRTEMRKSSPRSQELVKIAGEGLKLTANPKTRRAKQLREIWQSRHTYAVKKRSKRRAANLRNAADARRAENEDRIDKYLRGSYISARYTPGMEDDQETSLRGYRYWTRKFARDLADWRSGKLTEPGVLEDDQSNIETWGGNVLASWPQPPRGQGVGSFLSRLTAPDDVRALWDANPTDNTGSNEPSGPTPQELAQQQADALKAINEELVLMRKRAEFIGNTSEGALARAVTAVVSGQIGGQVGLGFASPSYTGNYARY